MRDKLPLRPCSVMSPKNAESLPLTCAVSEDPEQEHCPGHGGDAHRTRAPQAPGLEGGVLGALSYLQDPLGEGGVSCKSASPLSSCPIVTLMSPGGYIKRGRCCHLTQTLFLLISLPVVPVASFLMVFWTERLRAERWAGWALLLAPAT